MDCQIMTNEESSQGNRRYEPTRYDITQHKEVEEKLRHRLNVEHALARITSLLVGKGEADIKQILRIIGEAIHVNRIHIEVFRDDLPHSVKSFTWHDAQNISAESSLVNGDQELFSWGFNQLHHYNHIVISDRSSLPPEAAAEKTSLERRGACAALFLPINGIEKSLLGYIAFYDTKQSRLWQEEDIQSLNMLAEMLAAYGEQKKMEKALHTSQAQFKTLCDTAPAMIFVYSDPGNDASVHYLNDSYNTLGYIPAENINRSAWDFVHPDFVDLAKSRALARLRGEPVPNRYACKFLLGNGESRWGDLSMNTIEWEGKPALMGVIYDIDERMQMEEKLRQARDELEKRIDERTVELLLVNRELEKEIVERQYAEERLLLSEASYRAIVEDQSEFIMRLLPDFTVTFVNEAVCRFFRKSARDLIGHSIFPAIFKEDQAKVTAGFQSLNQDYIEDLISFRVKKPNGEICWQEWGGRVIANDQEIVEIQIVGRDVSKRKHTEEALKRSEANFRKLAETLPAMIYIYSEGRLLYVNTMLETLSGIPKEQLLQMNPMELFHPDCREQVIKNTIARLQGEKIPPYEVSMVNKLDGNRVWGYLYADMIEFEGKHSILGIVADITERKIMEADLLQTSKLESVGILAGGIAHDFNNILTVISGNVSLAKIIMEDTNDLTEVLTEVETAAFQARDLTQQLLTFSQGGAPIKETASIQELLRESANFVLRGSNVNCSFAIADDLWAVNIDKGQINQVINNLVINANQAMPDGGTIQLSAANIYPDTDLPPSLKEEHYIMISVKDTGIGIDSDDLSKIFDPYFSTKQSGHGLGLATCYSIIKKHDGDITVSSEPDHGTTVNIYLPALPAVTVEENNLPEAPLYGQGKILIMDDEAVVRETLGRMLNCLGYTTGF
ncbi:MAG TPA: PAS domain S-box protein, partial [Syntrophomonas sp.]|nr:PAS domain S-box protein [Syntrophomonas sp.]